MSSNLLKPLSHHKAKKDSISIRSNQDQVCQKAESSSWLNKDRLAGLREEPLKRPHSIIVAMAATETLRGGPSISYSSIVFSMGILLWFKNDCPSTCRPTQNTTRTHKEDIKMCCVMYMCVKTNTYAHLFAYTNIQMHGTLLLSTVSGPFASFLSLTFLFALLALFSCPTSRFFRPLASFLSTSMTVILLHICSGSLRLSVVMNLLAPNFSYQLPPSFGLLRSGTTPCVSLCF